MKSKLVFRPCEPFALLWSLHFLKKGPQLLENKHSPSHNSKKTTHTKHCNGLYFLISVTGVFCACVCARVCAYWGVSILLIAIIRYLDTRIICIPEQSYCYQGDDVIMMVIFTLPGARHCLTVSAYVCVCARAPVQGAYLCMLCHLHSMSMSNWHRLISPWNPFYMVSKVTASSVSIVGQAETRQHAHIVYGRAHQHTNRAVVNVQESKSLLISSIY